MLQYSLIRWVSILLYILQPVSFPQQILMPGKPKSKDICIGVFWVILIKLHLVAHLDFGLEFGMHWSGGCSTHTFKLGSYFPSRAHPSHLPHTCWRADGDLTYRVSSLFWQTQAHRHINLLELWEVHLTHHYLATLVHCLTAPWWLKRTQTIRAEPRAPPFAEKQSTF